MQRTLLLGAACRIVLTFFTTVINFYVQPIQYSLHISLADLRGGASPVKTSQRDCRHIKSL